MISDIATRWQQRHWEKRERSPVSVDKIHSKGVKGVPGRQRPQRSGRDGTPASRALALTCGFIVVHGDAVQL